MKIMSIVGARPNFMKVAPIISAIREHNERVASNSPDSAATMIQHVLVHTGQHYDRAMSDSFFTDLQMPDPDIHMGVGSGSHAAQTAEIMARFERTLLQEKPDLMIVVGDVNSTVACALVASKISYDSIGTRPLIAHVEAGLRSFDRSMPEEINRILTDHLSDLLFVTEESGIENLRKEGIANEKINFAGNTMIDSLRTCEERASASEILKTLGLQERTNGNGSAHSIDPYVLLTLHRPANVDNPEAFLNILLGLQELTAKYPVIFPVHPRTRKRIQEFGFAESCGIRSTGPGERGLAPKGLTLTDPLGYLEFLCLMKHAALVVTDSGGIQEETTCLGVACVTVRENTERPITLTRGTNVLAGVCKEGIQHAIRQQWGRQFDKEAPPMWDGKASRRIVDTVIRAVDSKRSESHPVQVDVRR